MAQGDIEVFAQKNQGLRQKSKGRRDFILVHLTTRQVKWKLGICDPVAIIIFATDRINLLQILHQPVLIQRNRKIDLVIVRSVMSPFCEKGRSIPETNQSTTNLQNLGSGTLN